MTDSPNCFIGYHVHSDTKPLCKAIYVSESSILVQTNFTPTLYTYRAHFGKWRQKTSFQGLLYEILNGFWTQLTAEDDQGMGKDQELFWFWRILLLKKQSSYREVYKLHFFLFNVFMQWGGTCFHWSSAWHNIGSHPWSSRKSYNSSSTHIYQG